MAAGTIKSLTGGRSVLVIEENSGLRAACEALARLGLVNGAAGNHADGVSGRSR